MRTYLVTGGAGFIGSHLIDYLLNEGHKVITVDNFNNYYDPRIKERNVIEHLKNDNYTLVRNDIRDFEAMKEIFVDSNIDTVVHLAAMAGVRPSIEDPILYQEVNGRGTQNILELCKEFNVKKIVLASSSSVYGNNKVVPFSETDVVDFAISPYAATKKANEVMGHVYHKLYDMNMIFLRFFTVYGPRQRPDLAIHKFTKLISNGEFIPFYGDGTTSRDYTFIDDIIDGVVKSIRYVENEEDVYEVFNLGESEPINLSTMVETIGNALELEVKKNVMPMQPGDVNHTYANITKAKEMLGYNPHTSFEDGIQKFVEWYKSIN